MVNRTLKLTPETRGQFAEKADFNQLIPLWQGRQDLNLRHPVLETGALPTELLP